MIDVSSLRDLEAKVEWTFNPGNIFVDGPSCSTTVPSTILSRSLSSSTPTPTPIPIPTQTLHSSSPATSNSTSVKCIWDCEDANGSRPLMLVEA